MSPNGKACSKILSFIEEAEFKERGRAGKEKRIKEVEKLSAL